MTLETLGLADLGALDLIEHDYESSRAAYAAALTQLRSRGEKYWELETLKGIGLASLGLGQRGEARAAFAEMLELALAENRTHSVYVAGALSGIALAADPAAADRAARLRGAVAQLNSDAGVVMNAYDEAAAELEAGFERELVAGLGEEAWEREKAAGSTMTLEQALAVAQFLCGRPASAVRPAPDDAGKRHSSSGTCVTLTAGDGAAKPDSRDVTESGGKNGKVRRSLTFACVCSL